MTTNKNERVEKYLRNKMSESEKSAFQFELMQDENLQQDVKSMRVVQKTLIANSRIGNVEQSLSSYWKWLLPLLLLPILYFLWNKSNVETVSPQSPNTETLSPVVAEEEIKADKTESTKIQNPIEEKEKEPKVIKEQKREEVKSPLPKIQNPQQPIAMANYEPNALLESLINSNTRGTETTFTIERRQADLSLVKKGASTNFHISGRAESDDDLSESSFNLYIFSNKVEEYRGFSPKFTQELNFEQKDDLYLFEVQVGIVLQPGLYYYLIEDADTEELFFVEKFEVK